MSKRQSVSPGPPQPPGQATRRRDLLWAAVLVGALSLIAFSHSISHDFVNFDDDTYVTANDNVQAGLGWKGFRWAWTTFHSANWHPLTWLSLQLDVTLFSGPGSVAFHITNVFLHAINTVLLLIVLHSLTGAVWRSAIVAAIFGVHPLHVESVAWISERKDLLSTLFGFLALWAYAAWATRRGWLAYLGLLLAFAASLLAKPMWVTLPCLLLVLDFWPLGRLRRGNILPLLLEKLPLFALSAASSVVTVRAQQGSKAFDALAGLSLPARVLNAVESYAIYLRETVWPTGLTVFYPHPGEAIDPVPALAAGALLAVITGLVLWQTRRRPYLLAGWLWFVGMLVPVIGIVQVGVQAHADRYMYVPMVGLLIAVAWGGGELAAAAPWLRTSLRGVAVLAIAACLALTLRQMTFWANSTTLWERALTVTQDNFVAHGNLADIYFVQGRSEDALFHYRESARLFPTARQYRNLGVRLQWLGRGEESIAALQEALRLQPDDVDTLRVLGRLYLEQRKFAEATEYYGEYDRLRPDTADAKFLLGQVRAVAGDTSEALAYFEQAAQLNPRNPQYPTSTGLALLRLDKREEALRAFDHALQLNPRFAAAHSGKGDVQAFAANWKEATDSYERAALLAQTNARYYLAFAGTLREAGNANKAAQVAALAIRIDPTVPDGAVAEAWRMATSNDAKQRYAKRALFWAKLACDLVRDPPARALDALAAAYAESGQFNRATDAAERALKKAEAAPAQAALAAEVRQRLALYKAGKPYRQDTTPSPTTGSTGR